MRKPKRGRYLIGLWLLGALAITSLPGIAWAEEDVLTEELVEEMPEDLLTEEAEAVALVESASAEEEGESLEEEELISEIPEYYKQTRVGEALFTAQAPGEAFGGTEPEFLVQEISLGEAPYLNALYAAEGDGASLYGKAYSFGFYGETGEIMVPASKVSVVVDYGESPLSAGIPTTFSQVGIKVYRFVMGEDGSYQAKELSSSILSEGKGFGGAKKVSFSAEEGFAFAILSTARDDSLYQADGLVWAEEPLEEELLEEDPLIEDVTGELVTESLEEGVLYEEAIVPKEASLTLTLHRTDDLEDKPSFVLKNSRERILGVEGEGGEVSFFLAYSEEGNHQYLLRLEGGEGLTLGEDVAFTVLTGREENGALRAQAVAYVNQTPCDLGNVFFSVVRK